MSKSRDVVVIDVREPFEFAAGHVEGALNLPPMRLMMGAPELKDIPKDTKLIVYCRTGSRSATSIQLLQQMGYKNVINGINAEQVKKRWLTTD